MWRHQDRHKSAREQGVVLVAVEQVMVVLDLERGQERDQEQGQAKDLEMAQVAKDLEMVQPHNFYRCKHRFHASRHQLLQTRLP